jgi:DNA polymerase-3 subunit delta'
MNEESQNALLKTLEEPPIRSVIILTTSKLRALFATVVSRCQHVKFSAFSIEHAKDVLVKRYNIKADTAYFLAHIAQSDFVDISVLAKDEVLDKKNRIIDEFSDFLGNPTNELSFLKESDEYILWVLSIILWWYRDMLVLKETAMPSIIANKDRVGDLKMQAARYTTLHLCRIINILLNTASMIHQTNVNSKLALTAMSMDILENANARE